MTVTNTVCYKEEVEKLHISPALVVLSSCDSGRGTVKPDGIQGMVRAFILARAQSVLTTMWRIHDESASTFMHYEHWLVPCSDASLSNSTVNCWV